MQTLPLTTSCRQMPLQRLLLRIAEQSDERALEDFHCHRTVFIGGAGTRVVFTTFVNHLRERARCQGWSDVVIERACDQLQDKFTRIPGADGKGIDCRKYFRAVLANVDPQASALEAECQVASLLQRMVVRHFFFSVKEVKRTWQQSRYLWRVNGGILVLLFPRQFAGRERLAWLKRHVPDADPFREGEQLRVQAIINEQLGTGEPLMLEDHVLPLTDTDIPSELVSRLESHGLAETVAVEKAERVDEQRPAIAALGAEKLKQMVLDIFERLETAQVDDRAVATAYGITAPTYSRWAGSTWDPGAMRRVPDLWKNTASVLAQYPAFREAAVAAGVWENVEAITGRAGS